MILVRIALVVGVFAMSIVAYLTWSIFREDPGTPEMRQIFLPDSQMRKTRNLEELL
jgi:hypothetical protein